MVSQTRSSNESVKAKKVLIVEDDQSILEVLAEKISEAGYEVIKATDGKSGLKIADDKKPDLVLLDLQLPKMDGKQFLKTIRSSENYKKLPVIILTNDGSSASEEFTSENAAPAYFIKADTSLKEVVEAIDYHLAQN